MLDVTDIPALRAGHIALVAVSVLLFLLRYRWHALATYTAKPRWVKIAPHLLDTLLLLSGALLVWLYRFPLLQTHWLQLKLLLVVGYILAGYRALRAPSPAQRRVALLLAIGQLLAIVWLVHFKPV